MTGTELGLVTVMYAAQEGCTGRFAAFHIGLATGVVCLIVGLTGFIVVPLRRMGVMKIPDFYVRRFGTGVRVYGGLLLACGVELTQTLTPAYRYTLGKRRVRRTPAQTFLATATNACCSPPD